MTGARAMAAALPGCAAAGSSARQAQCISDAAAAGVAGTAAAGGAGPVAAGGAGPVAAALPDPAARAAERAAATLPGPASVGQAAARPGRRPGWAAAAARRLSALAALALAGCAGAGPEPAAFAPPQGCVLQASVARADCRVLHVLSCGGETRTVDFRDGEEGRTTRHLHGLFELDGATPDGRARETFRYADPAALAGFRPEDPAARLTVRGVQTKIRRDGREDIAFSTLWRGAEARPVVSGRTLLRLPVAGEGAGGAIRAGGAVYYDPGLGVVVGHDLITPAGRLNATPDAVALPGQPGFGAASTTPGCGAD